MGYERTHSFQKKSKYTPQPTTQFSTRPFAAPVQKKHKGQPTPEELDNETFNQNKFEAFGLQLKEKSGTITPVEQERLGVLQAKMDDFWAQRRERASQFSYDYSKIPVHPPEGYATPQLQPMWRQGTPGVPIEEERSHLNSPQQSSVSPIQAKLTIGEPEDKYEQEADRVASQVVEQIHAPASPQSTQGQSVQRQEEEREELHANPESRSLNRQEESETPNKTGLPNDLKAGVENLSGYSIDDVRVHLNSPKPAQLQALAYTQGMEIHIAPGQEKHLPHEAWHVVQQIQGRVKPTMQMKGVQINDDEGLEKEADVMGSTLRGWNPDRQGNIEENRKLKISSSPRINSVVAQCGRSKKQRRRLLTRIIRQDQLSRPNIGIRSVRSSKRSLRRNLSPLEAKGSGVSLGSRIYSYMRRFGGAGIQGFHREGESTTRAKVVRGILLKMNEDPQRTTRSSRGKKFVMVVTHQDVLGRDRVHDLRRTQTRKIVLEGPRAKYKDMYEKHRTEGVVAVDGNVSVEDVLAMRAFRGVPEEEELKSLIEELLNEAETRLMELLEGDEQGRGKEEQRRKEDDGDDDDSMGGSMGNAQIRDDLVVSKV